MIKWQDSKAGLNPYWLAWVEWVLREADKAGLQPIVVSGYRSNEEQQRLYDNYRVGKSKLPAAAPGRSAHNHGLAVDVWSGNGRQQELIRLFKKHGAETVSNDPPHFQYPGFRAAIGGG